MPVIDLPPMPSSDHRFTLPVECAAFAMFAASVASAEPAWALWIATGHEQRMQYRERAWQILAPVYGRLLAGLPVAGDVEIVPPRPMTKDEIRASLARTGAACEGPAYTDEEST